MHFPRAADDVTNEIELPISRHLQRQVQWIVGQAVGTGTDAKDVDKE